MLLVDERCLQPDVVGADGGRKVVNYVPNNFHQAPRLLSEEIGIDTFVHTVSPIDNHGYFSFGTGNDYSTKVARSAKRLIVEDASNRPDRRLQLRAYARPPIQRLRRSARFCPRCIRLQRRQVHHYRSFHRGGG
jgi:acyl-CoA hydrolase